MAVLITGGAGFIGRVLSAEFVRAGHKVLVFDRVEPQESVRRALGEAAAFVQGDICDRDLVHRLVRDAGDGPIVHLSGLIGPACDLEPNLAVAVNVEGAVNVYEAARALGNRRVVVASTISVYGRGLPQPMVETLPTEPDGWYGLSKLMAEQAGNLYNRRYGLDFRAVRFAAVTGPFRTVGTRSSSLFTSYIAEKAALGQPYDIEVDASVSYPVVYIKDAVRALFLLATAPQAPRRVYNISSGNFVTAEAVAAVKARIPDAQLNYKPDPLIMAVVAGYKEWVIDCTAAKEELGWEPTYTVIQMVNDIIDTVQAGVTSKGS